MNKYQYKVQGVDYDVEIEEVEGNIAKVNVNGIPFEVELKQPISAAKHPTIVKPKVQAPPTPTGATIVQKSNEATSGSVGEASGRPLQAPLPGTITNVLVKEGESVFAGQVVVILEAMKMQNNIEAEYDGHVKSIKVKPGDSVMEGAVMMTIG